MLIKSDRDVEDNEYNNGRTYIFAADEDMQFVKRGTRSRIWQIFPSLCACLLCFSFGIMLGWPSPMYPRLLLETAVIPITLDQSALIAGFLMIGNIFGTPVSVFRPFGTKYGMLLSVLCMLCGWVLMWQAVNVYCIMASRFFVGFGNGYGMAQVKQYIKDLCEPSIAKTLIKLLNVYMIFGILIACSMGPFLDFLLFSIVCICITVVIFLVYLLLPHTPVELVKFKKTEQAKVLLHYLKPDLNAEIEVQKIKKCLEIQSDNSSIMEHIKSPMVLKNLALLTGLVFFQQFSGPPATVVYSQIMMNKFGCPYPEIFAVAYIGIFLLSNIFGYFYVNRYNDKYCLCFSSFTSCLLMTLKTLALYYNLNERWPYTSFVIIALFIFFHTIGLGCIPFSLTEKLFPKSVLPYVGLYQMILFSAMAIIITKLFQVLFTNFAFYVPFILFGSVSFVASIFVLIFVPRALPVLE